MGCNSTMSKRLIYCGSSVETQIICEKKGVDRRDSRACSVQLPRKSCDIKSTFQCPFEFLHSQHSFCKRRESSLIPDQKWSNSIQTTVASRDFCLIENEHVTEIVFVVIDANRIMELDLGGEWTGV